MALSANAPGPALPDVILSLRALQDQAGEFSESFWIQADYESGLRSWSEDPGFLDRLTPFAQANGSGSFYALWDDGSGKPLSQHPIVVFGDEGGVHVVAKDMTGLLQLLSYDVEISVDFDSAYFYRDPDEKNESEGAAAYHAWLKASHNLDPHTEPDLIIAAAQEKLKPAFDAWFAGFVPE